MPVRQITAHVTIAVHERFRRYSERLGLKDSEVTKLLISRERILDRLPTKKETAKRKRRAKAPKAITAHMNSMELVAEFHRHAAKRGLSRSLAAAILISQELDERWLERALSKP